MADDQLEDKSVKTIGNPLIFISHDTRDAELAEAFSNLLKSVSAGVLKEALNNPQPITVAVR